MFVAFIEGYCIIEGYCKLYADDNKIIKIIEDKSSAESSQSNIDPNNYKS